MSQVMNSPNLVNLTPRPDTPYAGETIRPDRKGGWEINHPMLGESQWITAIPLRGLADEIVAAFEKIADRAFACGVESVETKTKD